MIGCLLRGYGERHILSEVFFWVCFSVDIIFVAAIFYQPATIVL